jgi:hypothetical protein
MWPLLCGRYGRVCVCVPYRRKNEALRMWRRLHPRETRPCDLLPFFLSWRAYPCPKRFEKVFALNHWQIKVRESDVELLRHLIPWILCRNPPVDNEKQRRRVATRVVTSDRSCQVASRCDAHVYVSSCFTIRITVARAELRHGSNKLGL